jgi:hypothetical protein
VKNSSFERFRDTLTMPLWLLKKKDAVFIASYDEKSLAVKM